MKAEKEKSAPIAPQKIAVCIATCRRPQGLRRLLEGLAVQTISARPGFMVVVVDNDAGGSARSVCDDFFRSVGFSSQYLIEPIPGIPQTRNRGVRFSLDFGADLIAIIDDDEVPAPDWLERLERGMHEHGAHVVQGPVIPRFETAPPKWVIDGGFFDRQRFPTGTVRDIAATNNVLIRRSVFDKIGFFDPKWGMMGGDDTHFFMRAVRAGFKIVFSNEAVVFEDHSPDRLKLGWLILRRFRYGNTRGFCELEFLASYRHLIVVRDALLTIGRGTAGIILPWSRPFYKRFSSLLLAANGVGLLAALLGIRYRPYRKAHRTSISAP